MTHAAVAHDVLLARLADPADAFLMSPRPDESAVGYGAVDLRVGSIFLSAERSAVASVDASDPWEGSRLFQEVRVRPDRRFIMQPRQFVLASTFEYIAMPLDMAGMIQSRSTYGRMGIIAATASYIGPGFKGCPTLELVNVGEVAVELRPYEAICQIVLMTADEQAVRPSRYQCATRPDFARKAAP